MSYFDSYRARVNASGTSMQSAIYNTTKRQAIEYLMNSPTKSYVYLNDNPDLFPVIASDKETFHKRVYLFRPETVIHVGDYIRQTDGSIYLAVDQEKDNLYPQLIGELCNDVFEYVLVDKNVKIVIDYDDFKRPIYDYKKDPIKLPCVLTDKVPSMIDNSAIPLPEGALIIKIPYVKGKMPEVNYIFNHRDGQYKVANISYENVFSDDAGFVELRLQRGT